MTQEHVINAMTKNLMDQCAKIHQVQKELKLAKLKWLRIWFYIRQGSF